MEPGLRCVVRWSDADVIELRVSAWNGAFGGVAKAYVAIGHLEESADLLQGFPINPADTREVTFGAFGPKYAGGAVSFFFHCVDGSGHARVELKMESDRDASGKAESANFSLAIEAAAVDDFVRQLRQMGQTREGEAWLRSLPIKLQ